MAVDVELACLAETVFVRFLHCNMTLPPTLPFHLEGNHYTQLIPKEWGVTLLLHASSPQFEALSSGWPNPVFLEGCILNFQVLLPIFFFK